MTSNPARWPVGTAFCSLAMVISAMARAQQAAAVLRADADNTVHEEAAPDQASRLDDSTHSSDTARSSLPATQPSGVPGRQIQDNMLQQTQNTSQERAPERNHPTPQTPGSRTPDEATVPETPPPAHATEHMRWLDRTHQGLYDAMWHAAMRVDRWFGSEGDEEVYKSVYGSIAPAVLWDQHDHFKTPLRFNLNWPLPQINQRFNAFIGRVDPNEFISERDEPSGAFRRQYGPITEDQTLFGLSYHEPEKQGGYFTGGAGIRVATPPDPYLKGSYVYEHGMEARTSIAWPKDQPGQRRRRSLGLGLGFEMLFGTTDFLARPVTF
jgi:hypothetical protein